MNAICQTCKKDFPASQAHRKGGKTMYCSGKCYLATRKNLEERQCTFCGTSIFKPPWMYKTEKVFCSIACVGRQNAVNVKRQDRIEGDVVYIALTHNQWAIVDRSDYESIPELREMNWHVAWKEECKTFYVKRSMRGGSRLFLHQAIMGLNPGMHIDHKDHNGLNNRRENLRVCTPKQNMANIRKCRGETSRYKGVCLCKNSTCRPWRAIIGGKHIGNFKTEEEAARAYNAKAIEVFGEFALLNIIE